MQRLLVLSHFLDQRGRWVKKRGRRTDGWFGAAERKQAGSSCHSPLPEIVRSWVRKLSWTCDSERVVWAKRWYLGPLSTHKTQKPEVFQKWRTVISSVLLCNSHPLRPTYCTEGTGSRSGDAPPLLTGLPGPDSMAARSFFPADRPSEELSLLASFLGVLPVE